MNALPALDDVGGSTPDKELLAAQIRANFESLVRASPSPMVRIVWAAPRLVACALRMQLVV